MIVADKQAEADNAQVQTHDQHVMGTLNGLVRAHQEQLWELADKLIRAEEERLTKSEDVSGFLSTDPSLTAWISTSTVTPSTWRLPVPV